MNTHLAHLLLNPPKFAARPRAPRPVAAVLRGVALALAGALLAASPVWAATRTWTGAATPNANWSAAGNWAGGIAPVSGDDVIFVNAAGNPLTSTVDAPITVSGLTRNATDGNTVMTINTLGNLALSGNILADTGGLTLSGPLTLASSINVWRVTAGTAGNIVFTNAPGDTAGISGNHAVTFTNLLGGSFFIFCNNPLSTWSGGAHVKYGNTRVNNVSSSGTPGAPTAGPFGTGRVTLGAAGETNLAIVSWVGGANLTLHNNWLVNADGGGTAESRRLANNLTAPLRLTLSGGMTLDDDLYLAGAGNNVTRLDGNLTGAGGLVLNSANLNLLLAGNNTFGGGTRVIGNGFVGLGSDTALGTSLVTFGETVGSGQVWTFAVNGPRTLANDVLIRAARFIVASGTMDGLAGNDLTLNGSVTMDHGSSNVRDIYLQRNLTINGELKGANPDNALRLTGGGKLTLTAANTYEGGTFINSATLNINADAALGADPGFPGANVTFSGAGGTLQIGGANVSLSPNRNLVMDAGVPMTLDTLGNHVTLNGVLSGGGNFTKLGAGTLTFTRAGNAINGYAFLDGKVVVDGGTFNDGLEFLVGWTAPGTMTLTGPTASSRAVTARLGNGANPGTLNLDGGTLQVDQLFAFAPPSTTASTIANFNGGTLRPWGAQPSRFPTFISGLTHAYIQAGGLFLDTAAFTLTVPQPLEHDPALGATPDGGLTKNGSGDLILPAVNTYTGGTTNNSGRLTLNTASRANGDYLLADYATNLVRVAAPGTSLTNASLTIGQWGYTYLELDFGSLGLPTAPPLWVRDTLTANGLVWLTMRGLLPGPGVAPLIKYGSLAGAGFDSFWLPGIPNATAVLSNNPAQGMIYLVVSEVNLPKWRGNLSSDWDIGLTENWVGTSSGLPTTYQEPVIPGAPVLFDDSAVNPAVNVTTTVSPYHVTVNNATQDYSFSGFGQISGPGGLTKTGAGRLTLETANTFTGPTILNGGTTVAAAPGALGAGPLAVNNATLDLDSAAQAVAVATFTNATVIGADGLLSATSFTLNDSAMGGHLFSVDTSRVTGGTVSLTTSNRLRRVEIQSGRLRATDPMALSPGGFDYGTMTAISPGAALEWEGSLDSDEHYSFTGTGPDGQGALRLVGGLMNHTMHMAMDGDATLRVGPDAFWLHSGHLYTTLPGPITFTKLGAGHFWIAALSYAQIALDAREGTLGVWGTAGGQITVRDGATLAGIGAINGPVTVQAGGTLAPGVGVAGYEAFRVHPLTVASSLTLQGAVAIELSKSDGVLTNDQVKGIATVNYGGALVVTHLGPDALAAGDTFRLFQAGTYAGTFASVTLPPLSGGLVWANNLAVDGSIQVIVPPPQISGVARLADGNIRLDGAGPAGAGYRVLASEEVALPLGSWAEIGGGTFTGGAFSFADLTATNYARRFYRVVTP